MKKARQKDQRTVKDLAEEYKDPDEFVNELKKSLKIIPREQGKTFLEVGETLYKSSYYYLALNVWHRALYFFENNNNKGGELISHGNLGLIYHCLGNFKKSIEHYEEGLKIARKVRGNRSAELKCRKGLGIVYHSLGNSKKALIYHKKALKIAKKINDKIEKSKCYTNFALSHYNLGNHEKAFIYHKKALKIAKETGNRTLKSICYGNLGNFYNFMGNFKMAIEHYEKSLKIAKEIGDKSTESKCYTGFGNVYLNIGNFGKAIGYYKKSIDIYKKIGDRYEESKCYMDFGITYHSMGVYRKSIEHYEKSLKIAKEIGDKSTESKCYMNIGNLIRNFGNFKIAIEYYEKSLKIAKDIGNKALESKCYGNLGNAYRNVKDFEKALEYFRTSLEIVKEIEDEIGESICYGNFGVVYYDLKNPKKAIECYKKSLEIIKKTGNIELERFINLGLGLVYWEYEFKPKLAYKNLKRSIDISELILGNLIEDEYKIGFSSRASDTYQYMVPLCLELEKKEEAFEYTERSKSRALLGLLAATEIRPTAEIINELQSLLDQEEKYLATLRAIQMQHLRWSRIPAEPGEVEKIYENLTHIYNEIEKYDPEYVYVRKGKPLSLDNMQDMLSSQKRDTVLIEYFITENKAIIFVISSKDGKFHIKTVPLSQKDLNKYTENYQIKMAYCSSFQHIDKKLLELGKYLIDPVSDYLAKGDLIYFVPYGPLHYIPLHAVELKGEPLIKRHPIVYAPSASIIKFCQSKGSNKLKSCASFGVDPDPYERIKEAVEKEAEEVAGLFNGTSYTDCQVTKSTVLKKCLDKDVIHFACHGKFVNADPLSSGVVLHNNVVLTAREIFNMRLTTELVTLSACQTGVNKRSPGDELIGLTRAFLYAGAPSVIVSLWLVDSPSTYELMLEFYRLLEKGTDKATALQKAQIKIMEEKEYTNPYYWAPFVLIGDWQ